MKINGGKVKVRVFRVCTRLEEVAEAMAMNVEC
jgi:hypothetical protein